MGDSFAKGLVVGYGCGVINNTVVIVFNAISKVVLFVVDFYNICGHIGGDGGANHRVKAVSVFQLVLERVHKGAELSGSVIAQRFVLNAVVVILHGVVVAVFGPLGIEGQMACGACFHAGGVAGEIRGGIPAGKLMAGQSGIGVREGILNGVGALVYSLNGAAVGEVGDVIHIGFPLCGQDHIVRQPAALLDGGIPTGKGIAHPAGDVGADVGHADLVIKDDGFISAFEAAAVGVQGNGVGGHIDNCLHISLLDIASVALFAVSAVQLGGFCGAVDRRPGAVLIGVHNGGVVVARICGVVALFCHSNDSAVLQGQRHDFNAVVIRNAFFLVQPLPYGIITDTVDDAVLGLFQFHGHGGVPMLGDRIPCQGKIFAAVDGRIIPAGDLDLSGFGTKGLCHVRKLYPELEVQHIRVVFHVNDNVVGRATVRIRGLVDSFADNVVTVQRDVGAVIVSGGEVFVERLKLVGIRVGGAVISVPVADTLNVVCHINTCIAAPKHMG